MFQVWLDLKRAYFFYFFIHGSIGKLSLCFLKVIFCTYLSVLRRKVQAFVLCGTTKIAYFFFEGVGKNTIKCSILGARGAKICIAMTEFMNGRCLFLRRIWLGIQFRQRYSDIKDRKPNICWIFLAWHDPETQRVQELILSLFKVHSFLTYGWKSVEFWWYFDSFCEHMLFWRVFSSCIPYKIQT